MDPGESSRTVQLCDAAPSGTGFFSTAREDEMADTAFVVLILAGFGLCTLILRVLHSRGGQR